MEKQDLNNILLTDTEFYSKYGSYVSGLKKHNITTVGQLLSQDVNDLNLHFNTRIELSVFIDMLEYRYFGEPLPYVDLLDSKIIINEIKEAYHSYEYDTRLPLLTPQNQQIILPLTRMLGISERLLGRMIYYFVESIKVTKMPASVCENLKLIDFLTFVATSCQSCESVKPYAKAYTEEYELENKCAVRKLATLSEELKKLIEARQKFNIAITYMRSEIQKVSDESSKTK